MKFGGVDLNLMEQVRAVQAVLEHGPQRQGMRPGARGDPRYCRRTTELRADTDPDRAGQPAPQGGVMVRPCPQQTGPGAAMTVKLHCDSRNVKTTGRPYAGKSHVWFDKGGQGKPTQYLASTLLPNYPLNKRIILSIGRHSLSTDPKPPLKPPENHSLFTCYRRRKRRSRRRRFPR